MLRQDFAATPSLVTFLRIPRYRQLFRNLRKPKCASRLLRVRDARKLFSVSEVSQSSHLPLIFDQVRFRNKRDREPLHICLNPVSPYLIEGHLSDGGQDVDMVLLGAEPDVFLVIEKVVGLQALEWRPERKESAEGSAGILFRGPDEDVEVIGGAYIAMRVHGHSTHHSVFNLGGGERG